MRRFSKIGSILIVLLLGTTILSSCSYSKKLEQISNFTPAPAVVTAEPTLSPTPTIKIAEDTNSENFLFLEFHSLMDIMTTSQYNYVMTSIKNYFNSLYQANFRNYQFTQYRTINVDMLNGRFSFPSDNESAVPYDRFKEAFADINQEYMLILDADSIKSDDPNYTFTVKLYINRTETCTFDFAVNKKSLKINVK